MAKTAVNKSQLIREALAAHPEKTPVEISRSLMRIQGLEKSVRLMCSKTSNTI